MTHPALRPLAWVVLQLLLLCLGAMSLLWNLVATLLYWWMPRHMGRRLGRASISCVYRRFWRMAAFTGLLRMESSALDALRDEGGLVVVANHPSLLDALMIVAQLPRGVCVMKASLMRNIFLGPGARLARYIRNDSPRSMVRLAVADLREGGHLVLFPEGTRTTQTPINPFRPGFTLIAKLADVPIQTVFIDTDSPYLGKGWPLWRLPPLPIRFSVRLGRRFAPTADAQQLLEEVEAYFAANVRRTP